MSLILDALGTMLKRIKDENTQAPNANYTGIEINKDFQQHWKPETNLKYKVEDVRESNALSNMSFAISLFTFQFLAEKDRLSLLQKIYDNLVDGGAFVMNSKNLLNECQSPRYGGLLIRFQRQSFTEKEILDKEQELRHLAKLTTENLLISQLRSVGFRGIQIFWRNFNFIGVLAMKRPPEDVGDE